MPSRKAALIAFAAFILLLAVVLVSKPRSPSISASTGEMLVPTAPPALLSLKAEDITGVEVQSQEGKLILGRGADGLWRILLPVEAAADQQAVADLVVPLASLPVSRSLPEDAGSSDDFGLDPPEFTVSLLAGASAAVVIEVGALNPDGTKRYVRLGGTPTIHLVYSYQLDRLKGMVMQPPLVATPTLEAIGTATPPQ